MGDIDQRAATALYGSAEEKAALAETQGAEADQAAADKEAQSDAEAPVVHPGADMDARASAALYPDRSLEYEEGRALLDTSGRLIEKPLEGCGATFEDLVQRNVGCLQRADLAGKDLRRVNLDGAVAPGANLSNSKVGSIRFAECQDANLEGTVFAPGSSVAGTDFSGCTLDENTSFEGVRIDGAIFAPGQLEKTHNYRRALGRPQIKAAKNDA